MKRTTPPKVGLWRSGFPFIQRLERMQREMNRAFDEFFHDDFTATGSQFDRNWLPAVDIEEMNDTYVLKAELPGIEKEDVKITFDNNILTIRGEKKAENDRKQGNYHRIERFSGTVSPDAIDAAYVDGVRPITLPKKEEAKEKLIEVKVN
jgi:HSP20 family protein